MISTNCGHPFQELNYVDASLTDFDLRDIGLWPVHQVRQGLLGHAGIFPGLAQLRDQDLVRF
ncbi:MAG: hypothetical protein MRY64_11615 [Hyphomonadaceae bacterium]|nr:hypothetical protein [Hyphomonadaceae bacterium]